MANIKNRMLFCLTHDILKAVCYITPFRKAQIFILDLQIKNGIFWGAISDSDNWELIY